MKKSLCVTLVSLGVGSTACGPAGADFVGSWSGTATSAITWTLPDRVQTDSGQGPMQFEIREGSTSDLVVQLQTCELPVDVDGAKAKLQPGSRCGSNTVESGLLTLSKRTLRLSIIVGSSGKLGDGTPYQYKATLGGTFARFDVD